MPQAPFIVAHDNLDSKRELWGLLKRLSPRRRVKFLRWCCTQATLPSTSIQPRVQPATDERAELAMRDDSADAALTYECYFDIFAMANQYELDLDRALNKLVELARRA